MNISAAFCGSIAKDYGVHASNTEPDVPLLLYSSEPTMNFQYLPLPVTGTHIRLLELQPSQEPDDVCVRLDLTTSLEGCKLPYEALSYVWGSLDDLVTIRVDKNQEMSISPNLATALKHLRRRDVARLLWVDALCINQCDNKERNSQVAIMGSIYGQAQNVIVWLGVEDEKITRAIQSLEKLGSSVRVDWYHYTFDHESSDTAVAACHDVEVRKIMGDKREVSALNYLIHQPWFERLWIRQEVGLSKEATVIAGHVQISWRTLTCAVFMMNLRAEIAQAALGHDGQAFIKRLALILPVCSSRVYFLDSMRQEVSQAKCSDSRDRIYAVLSLMHSSYKGLGIRPQYALTVEEVYMDATLRFIRSQNSLSIFLQCELSENHPWPTWVPDWSKEMSSYPISGTPSNASAYLQSVTSYQGHGTLRVAGLHTATISSIKLMNAEFLSQGLEHVVKELWSFVSDSQQLCCRKKSENGHRLRTFCDTLACGMFQHATFPKSKDWPDLDVCAQIVASVLHGHPPDESRDGFHEEAWKFLFCVQRYCHNRVLFIAADGLFGVAPQSTKVGDQVCILLGCDSSMICRPCRDNKYQLIGQSYMPGINTGEALVGPLPSHLRAVNYLAESNDGFHFAYWDVNRGRLSFNDPRLSSLPVDIGLHTALWDTGNFKRIQIDLEALRNAGIPIKDFDFV